jgi:hypothetical protein
MPDTSRTSHGHRSRSRSESGNPSDGSRKGNLEPVYYFTGSIVLLIFAKLMHASLLSPAAGATGIIILAVSKIWKSRAGIILSVICIFAMALVNSWEWVDRYYQAVLSAEIISVPLVFRSVLCESLILAIMAWTYHRMMRSIHNRMGQKWLVKKAYVIIFKLFFYSQLFLVLFWVIAFLMEITQPYTGLGTQDSAMVAAALSLLTAGIPATIYLSKSSPVERKHRRHIRHHRHEGDGQLKTPELIK